MYLDCSPRLLLYLLWVEWPLLLLLSALILEHHHLMPVNEIMMHLRQRHLARYPLGGLPVPMKILIPHLCRHAVVYLRQLENLSNKRYVEIYARMIGFTDCVTEIWRCRYVFWKRILFFSSKLYCKQVCDTTPSCTTYTCCVCSQGQ